MSYEPFLGVNLLVSHDLLMALPVLVEGLVLATLLPLLAILMYVWAITTDRF